MKFLYKCLRILIILSLLVSSPSSSNQITEEFLPYYNDFIFFLNNHCTDKDYNHLLNLTLNFGDLSKKDLAGETTYYTYAIKLTTVQWYYADIVIDEKTWSKMNQDEKFALIFHELTHALFFYPDLKDKKYRHHYMFYQVDRVSMKEFIRQINELLTMLCQKK